MLSEETNFKCKLFEQIILEQKMSLQKMFEQKNARTGQSLVIRQG